jgi:ribose 5-phosphate isomerase B
MPDKGPRVAVGCDHAGLRLKADLLEALRERGVEVDDVGTHDAASCDYPDYGHAVARRVELGQSELGLLVCGTGVGMAMAANRHPGVRAVVCSDTFSARMAREHNHANVLCVGERVVGPGLAREILFAFLDARFEGGRHERRVGKIERPDPETPET